MFLPSHLFTGSGSDQKVPDLTSSGSATLVGVEGRVRGGGGGGTGMGPI